MGTDIIMSGVLVDLYIGGFDAGVRDPVIIALVEVLEVDVVAVGILISRFGSVIIYN